ncbi:unnamed protein product [[Actinomadura] parvosata subsp. kistnae]|nr:unnamed protein product [Actinomadura parvosata subsp. kistnae]
MHPFPRGWKTRTVTSSVRRPARPAGWSCGAPGRAASARRGGHGSPAGMGVAVSG